MLNSMTGFGGCQAQVAPFGKINVELRSSNHKFLEIVFHLPEGFLSIEDRIKKIIESRLKRGRITCVINIIGADSQGVSINKTLLKEYLSTITHIKRQLRIPGELTLDTLINLPGVLSLAESSAPQGRIWPHINLLARQALDELIDMRQKEGRAVYGFFKSRAQALNTALEAIKANFKSMIKERRPKITSDEEWASFLKESDITEELERLAFHIRNFKNKLSKSGPVGKELDFIAQEMQREANTVGAKSCSPAISGRVIQLKSQIEKIREQAQNIE